MACFSVIAHPTAMAIPWSFGFAGQFHSEPPRSSLRTHFVYSSDVDLRMPANALVADYGAGRQRGMLWLADGRC